MKTRTMTTAAMLMLALLATPCQAASVSNPDAVQANLRQGVIEQMGGALRISGKNYAFSSATAVVHDSKGASSSASRLALGQTVVFSIVEEGSQARIKELWIIH